MFFGKKEKKPHETFHILKMKTHFEKEPYFENESSFRNPFLKFDLIQWTAIQTEVGPLNMVYQYAMINDPWHKDIQTEVGPLNK